MVIEPVAGCFLFVNMQVTFAPAGRFTVTPWFVKVVPVAVVQLIADKVQPATLLSLKVYTPEPRLVNVCVLESPLVLLPSSSRVKPLTPGPAAEKTKSCGSIGNACLTIVIEPGPG